MSPRSRDTLRAKLHTECYSKGGPKFNKHLGALTVYYGAACWDPYRQCQISALDRVQNKVAKFAHHSGHSEWESLGQRRKIARMCALYKAYTGERARKAIGDRLQAPSYLSMVDHYWEIRRQKTKNRHREILLCE